PVAIHRHDGSARRLDEARAPRREDLDHALAGAGPRRAGECPVDVELDAGRAGAEDVELVQEGADARARTRLGLIAASLAAVVVGDDVLLCHIGRVVPAHLVLDRACARHRLLRHDRGLTGRSLVAGTLDLVRVVVRLPYGALLPGRGGRALDRHRQ